MYKIVATMQDPLILEQLKFIKENIEYGDKLFISNQLDISYSTVSSVLHGKFLGSNGKQILDFAVTMLIRRLENNKAQAEKLRNKVSKIA